MKLQFWLITIFLFLQFVLNLGNNQELRFNQVHMDQVLMSPKGTHYAKLSDLGTLVIFLAGATYDNNNFDNNNDHSLDIPVWVTRNFKAGRAPFTFMILPSGNLNVLDYKGNPVWADGPNNAGVGPYRAELTDDGYIKVIDSTETVVWKSHH